MRHAATTGGGGDTATRTVHGHYDPDTDKWLLNGLTLGYDEAIAVWYAGTPRNYDATMFYGGQHTIRTNLPPRVDQSNMVKFQQAFICCSNMEVANIGSANTCNNMFYAVPKLKKVIGTMFGGGNPAPYLTCPVEEMHFGWWGTSTQAYDLRNLPNLNADSLQWMVSNAQTTTQGTRTVTLHADAYARLTDDMKALAAEKNITFVSAS
jgi:hypothetical protein